jgi:glycerophosphoryl diester phosphodiesterase
LEIKINNLENVGVIDSWGKDFVKIGHRGASGYAPENTLVSFQKAIELGVDAIEFDVRICKSGEAVVFHDATLNRITNGKGLVKNKTIFELEKLKIGNGQKIQSLEEALNFINGRVAVNIEIKEKLAMLPVIKILQEQTKQGNWRKEQFLISSFDYKLLVKFRMLCPFVRIGLLIGKQRLGDCIEKAKFLECFSLNLPVNLVSIPVIEKTHKEGFRVFVWTSNSLNEIKQLRGMGIDGIFSDYPDRLIIN